jgi:hypothetical protein
MSAPPQGAAQSAALLARLVTAANDKAASLPTQLHVGWISAALPEGVPPVALQSANAVATQCATRLLARAYEVRWPTFVSMRQPANRIALLMRETLLQVLAAAAFYGRSGDVRRGVQRHTRRALAALLGQRAFEALLRTPDTAREVRPIVGRDLEPDRCAAAGYHVLRAQGLLTCRDACLIARLSLLPGSISRSTRYATAAPAVPFVADLFNRFDDFFPEHAWMFGSDMNLALSA